MPNEFDITKNSGIIIAPPKPTDFILGVSSPLVVGDVEPTGDWRPYTPTPEKQWSQQFDTMNCTAFSYTNIIETLINRLIKKGLVSVEFMQFLQTNGYLDANGLLDTSERALGSMAGTDENGNHLATVAETARKNGLAPNSMWKWDTNVVLDIDEYYKTPPQQVFDVAKKFKQFVDLPYQWIGVGPPVDISKYPLAMKVSPLYVALKTCPGWNSPPVTWCGATDVNHAVELVKFDNQANGFIFDSYDPYTKELQLNYAIPYALQIMAIVKKGIKKMIGYKKENDATVYVELQGVLVPLADWDAFVSLGGSTESIVALTEAQFAKFTVNNSVLFKSNN